ncbi:MAG TPA: hypothetical protein VK151_02205 [Fluviicola sp.]|nr:hypothetical protein [Fluviicola sp.]
MKQLIVLLGILFFGLQAYAQKGVSGTFQYTASISLPDTNLVLKSWNVRVMTNDTIVRVETETQLGIQVYIRHMELKKAYLLLDYDGNKYAIQTDLEENHKRDTMAPEYSVKRTWKSKTIAGVKCRRYIVRDKNQTEGYECWFAKKIDHKYLEVYPEVPGLAVDYYLPSPDGLIHYELTRLDLTPVNRDLFGVPSDYKRLTFEEFVNMISQ